MGFGLALGLIAVACTPGTELDGAAELDGPAVSGSTAVDATPSTSTPPESTSSVVEDEVDAGGDAPSPVAAEEDWVEITQQVRDAIAHSLENPDPDLVPLFSVPDTPVWGFYQQILTEYVDGGIRGLPGSAGTIVEAQLEDGSVEVGVIELRVAWQDDGYQAVGPDGSVVIEEPPAGVGVYRWILQGSVEDGWRVREMDYLGPYQPDSS